MKVRIIALAALFVFLFCSVAAATSVMKLELDQMVKAGDLIVIGKVTAVDSNVKSENTQVRTVVTLSVGQVFKGTAGNEVKIDVPGGKIADKFLMIPGAPKFQVGDEVLVILNKNNLGQYKVAGFFQGRYMVFTFNGTKYAVMDHGAGASIMDACDSAGLDCIKGQGRPVEPLDDLISKINKHLKVEPKEKNVE